jgi:dynein intermediate chain 2
MTQVEVSHHDPVYNVSWTMSKTMTEFMSVSTDGQVKWWDTKKMADAPLDTWELDGKDGTPLNISALCYEATAAPTKFLCGTELGRTVNCNKKAKGPNDRITQEYGPAGGGHFGPVVGIARNPFHQKNFITVGDWSTKIWFEDFNKLPIMTSSCSSSFMTCCQWAPNRAGVFFTGAHDGDFCVWDYYYKQSEPVVKLNVDGGIHCMAVNSSGSLVATGGNEGTVSLLQLSDSLVESADRHEKNVIEDMFARELKREKLLEQKYREAKSHKLKPPKVTETNNPAQMAEKYMLEETQKNVDKEYFKLLAPGNPDGATETE